MHIPLSRYISKEGEPVTAGELTLRGFFYGELDPSNSDAQEPPDYVWGASGSVGITLGEQSVYFDNFITGWWRREPTCEAVFEFDTVDSRVTNVDGEEVDGATLEKFFEAAGGECELYWAIDEAIQNLCKAAAPSALAVLDSEAEEWLEENAGNPPPAVAS